jgi:Tol biopolymer transport system component
MGAGTAIGDRAGRFEAVLIALTAALVGGVYLILWAGQHDRLSNDTFTEWHIPAYAALIGLILFVVFSADRAVRHGRGWRTAMPPGYESVVLGVVLLAVYPVVDLVWSATFGPPTDLEGLLGLPRLLIPAGLVLIAAGPLRAARRGVVVRGSALRHVPAVLAASLLLASLTIPLMALHPYFEVPAAAVPPGEEPDPADLGFFIVTSTTDRRVVTRLTSGPGDQEAAWSPDGERIAYVDGTDVAVMRSSGAGRRTLLGTPEREGWISWSPDGQRIAYMAEVPVVGAAATPGLPEPAPLPSPGTRAPGIGAGGDADWDVYTLSLEDGTVVRLTEDPALDGGPAWSPDGASIAFHSDRDGDYEIWVMPADGGPATQLTDDASSDISPRWSPEGTSLLFTSDRDGDYDLYAMAPDGSGVRRLTDTPQDEWAASWSPGGVDLAFMRGLDDGDAIFVRDGASGVEHRLTNDPDRQLWLATEPWSADGTTLVFSSGPREPSSSDGVSDPFDVARLLLTTAALTTVLLLAWHVGLWAIGTATAVFVVVGLLVGVVDDQLRFLPGLLIAGVVVDIAAHALRPWADTRRGLRAIAFLAPLAWLVAYMVTLVLGEGVRWSFTLSAGVVVAGAAIGLLLVPLLMAVPRETPGESG